MSARANLHLGEPEPARRSRRSGRPGFYAEAMEIELVYFDGCPSWRTLDERLRAVLDAADRTEVITYVRVETDEEAQRLQFHGSPTILIDGRDPFDRPGMGVGLTCRLYRTPAGMAGSPTTEQLAAVIR